MTEKMTSWIQPDKKKAIAGVCVATLAFDLCYFLLNVKCALLFGGLIALFSAVKIRVKQPAVLWILFALWGAALVWFTWQASVSSVNAGHEMLVTPGVILLNVMLILFLCGTWFTLTARWRLSFTLGTALLLLLSFVNGVVFQFRGKELAIADFLSVQTAWNVAAQYRPVFHPDMILDWMKWLLTVCIGFAFYPPVVTKKIVTRLWALLATVGVAMSFLLCSAHIPVKTWEKEGTRINGYYMNFFFGIRDSVVKKPKDYGEESIKRIEHMYTEEGEMPQDLPNVIVIMDESFADFSVLGSEVQTNREVTPFINRLKQNTQKGYALTSVYGGNTANAEFEFLTGHTLGFLPKDCVPYQQYIRDEIYTLPYYMRSLGYKTFATHPYYANGWSRERIYPYLGFNKFTFHDSYPQKNILRHFISDREMFEYVLRVTNEAEDMDKPLFLFGITMQNHGGYDYEGENFDPEIRLEGYEKEYPLAEQYLSLLYETDQAVKYLITELKKEKRDTIVLFFGDHFPKLEEEFHEMLQGGPAESLAEQQLHHTVPFFIWANFDIEEKETPITSLGYLGRHVLDAAGIPLSPYYQFLAEVEEQIPAVDSLGYYSKIMKEYISIEDAVATEEDWLEKYKTLQYNNLFDKKNRSDLFFGQYMSE